MYIALVYVIMRVNHVALVVLGVDVQRVYVYHELYTLAAILPHLSLSLHLVGFKGSSIGR